MNYRIILFLILLGALLVRSWGIGFGLPYNYFIDEGYLIYWAFYSGSHALRPPYYLYAPFVPMILLFEYALYYIGGFLLGTFSNPSQFFVHFLINPTVFFLIGRVTMAISGVATVWLVFITGKQLLSERIGLLAAFFLAFTFLHVKESHYIKQDVLLTFFVLASFYFSLKILQKGKLKDYILCGITFALAFGAKYHAVILMPVILLAHVLSTLSLRFPSSSRDVAIPARLLRRFAPRNDKKIIYRPFLSKLVILALSSFFTFSLIHPYFILEMKSTIEQTVPLAVGIKVGYSEQLQGKPIWWWYMFEHVPQGIGYPLFFAAMAGFIICLLRGIRRVKRGSHRVYFFIPLLPFIFFITIGSFTQMHFARYAVMIVPFFMLAAAIFLDSLSRRLRIRNILLIVFAVVLTLPTFSRTIQFDYPLTKPDTRTMAKQWFEQNVPSGAKVLVESTLRPEHPSSFNIPFVLDEESIDKRIQEADKIGQEALYLHALQEANMNKVGYDIVSTTNVGSVRNLLTDEEISIKDVSYYATNNVEYIILTSWVQKKMTQEFKTSLNQYYRLIKEFRPTYKFTTDPHLVRVDYAALDKVDIFRKDVIFGPVISIYQFKSGAL